jgi:hypothetical protein
MGVLPRAAVTVALLVLFPVMLLALLAGLVTVEVLAIGHSGFVAVKWLLLAGPAGLVLVRGLGTLVAKIGGEVEGYRLPRQPSRSCGHWCGGWPTWPAPGHRTRST